MIQVFRVLNRSSDKTFFLAVSLLDRFFYAKSTENGVLNKDDLHLFGLVCCFIASKIEDCFNITMQEIISDAGHSRFNLKQINEAEKEVYKTLDFKLCEKTIYDIVFEEIYNA